MCEFLIHTKRIMYQYTYENTTFKRYNKKYMTPPVFDAYKINAWAVISGVLSGVVVYQFMDYYATFLIADIIIAASFILNGFVLKSLYTNGFANATIARNTASYYLSNFYALFAQVAFWRIIISLPMTLLVYGNNAFIHNNLFWIVSICINFLMILVMRGCFVKDKYYNKSIQKAFSAVIDGPKECGEDYNELISKNKVCVHQLHHIENATSEYFACQDNFFDTAREIKNITSNYDEQWRIAVIYGNYCYVEEFPAHTPLYDRLQNILDKHKENAEALNKVVIELNKKPLIEKKQPLYIKKVNKNDNDDIVKDKEPVRNNSLWDNNVNWY